MKVTGQLQFIFIASVLLPQKEIMSLERPNLSGVAEKTDGNFLATLFKDILKGRRSEYQVRAKSYFLNDIDMEELRWVDRYGLIIFLMPSLQAIFIERKDKLYADD